MPRHHFPSPRNWKNPDMALAKMRRRCRIFLDFALWFIIRMTLISSGRFWRKHSGRWEAGRRQTIQKRSLKHPNSMVCFGFRRNISGYTMETSVFCPLMLPLRCSFVPSLLRDGMRLSTICVINLLMEKNSGVTMRIYPGH